MKSTKITKTNERFFTGEEVNLDEVLEIARNYLEQINRENENKLDCFRNIVEGVAKKYASKWVDREDLEQELWIKVLELIRDCGGEENVNPQMVARCCFNKAVDFYRYNRRRYDSKARLIDETESEEGHVDGGNNELYHAKLRTGYDEVVVKEIIDLFPEGSRERKYVVTKLYLYGEIDERSGVKDMLEMPKSANEEDILALIGFNSRYPASWGKMKYGIKEKIYRYLGMLPSSTNLSEEDMLKAIRERVLNLFRERRTGWIGINELQKDTVIKLLGCSKKQLLKAIDSSEKLLRGHASWGEFAMKNDPKFIQLTLESNDVIYGINGEEE